MPTVSITERTPLLKPHHNLANLSPLHFRLACLSVWSATFLAAFDGTVVATLLSPIGSSFHALHLASWLGTAYLLSLCCFTPVYGRLADALGRRNAQLVALAFFTLGTAACAAAPSMNALIAARCLAGVGGGGLTSVGSILLSDLVHIRKRGVYQGYANILYVSVCARGGGGGGSAVGGGRWAVGGGGRGGGNGGGRERRGRDAEENGLGGQEATNGGLAVGYEEWGGWT
jgi:MFS family permease